MDYALATWVGSPNYFANRAGHHPSYLILHGTAGFHRAIDVANFFATSASQVSSHYVVGQDGTVIQCVAEHDGAWANGPIVGDADPWWTPLVNPNWITISIEHVKPSTDNSDPLTTAQREASFALIKDICDRWHIPKRWADASGGITGHFSMDPVNRERCPGNFPWSDLWTYLQGAGMIDVTNPTVATYFQKISDTNWKCKKNGAIMGGAILSFYRSLGGYGLCGLTILGLPLGDEYNDTDMKQVSKQRFERGIVVWDPEHQIDNPPGSANCYLQHVETLYPLPEKLATAKKIADTISSALTGLVTPAQWAQLSQNFTQLTKQLT